MPIDISNIINDSASNSLIPARDPNAITGSAFIQANMNVSRTIRESNILSEFKAGNIPDFMRKFTAIKITSGQNTITYLTTPDYLCIGSDSDYVRIPMNPHTAQAIADQYDCTLPTRKMVNDIWKQSPNKVEPLPWGEPYDDSMMSTYRYGEHNRRIQAQLVNMDFKKLLSGHKKDVVLSNQMSPNNPKKRVTIFGWIHLNGQPIQGLNYWSHEDTYADYSHGIRLIANDVVVNGVPMRIQDVFGDTNLFALISDEGKLTFLRY